MDETRGRIVRPSRQTYRLALLNRWTPEEAGRLAGRLDGFPVSQNWTMRQLAAVEFLRWSIETGRIAGDTEAIA